MNNNNSVFLNFKSRYKALCLVNLYRKRPDQYILHSYRLLISFRKKVFSHLTYLSVRPQRYSIMYVQKLFLSKGIQGLLKLPYKRFMKRGFSKIKKQLYKQYSTSTNFFYKLIFCNPKRLVILFFSQFLVQFSRFLNKNSILLKSLSWEDIQLICSKYFLPFNQYSTAFTFLNRKNLKFNSLKWENLKLRYRNYLYKHFSQLKARCYSHYLLSS